MANKVAIPNIGTGLQHDKLIVTTGRTGDTDFTVCGPGSFAAARYGVLTGMFTTGPGMEHFYKMHWEWDPGESAKVTSFQANGHCLCGDTAYYVYDVIVIQE